MTTLLDAIADEIEGRELLVAARESEIEKLRDELDRLAAMKTTAEGLADAPALDADAATGESATAPAPQPEAEKPKASTDAAARPARTRTDPAGGRGAGGQTVEEANRLQVRAAVTALGECSVDQVCERTSLSKPTVKKALQALVRDGELVATGATKARRFSAPPSDRAAAEKAAASPMKSGGGAARLLRQIMDTLGSDPGLTEQQLAQALDVDRDDVAEGCGKALERGWVTLAPDGTYYAVTDDDTTDGQGGGTT